MVYGVCIWGWAEGGKINVLNKENSSIEYYFNVLIPKKESFLPRLVLLTG